MLCTFFKVQFYGRFMGNCKERKEFPCTPPLLSPVNVLVSCSCHNHGPTGMPPSWPIKGTSCQQQLHG